MRKHMVLLFAVLLLTGCAHKYAIPEGLTGTGTLPAASVAYVTFPSDGIDSNGRSYPQSGKWTQVAVSEALAGLGLNIVLAPALAPRDENALAASEAGAQLLVWLELVPWSDRATEWSGIPDRITLRTEVRNIATGALVSAQDIKASSRWATLGGDHPQDLLPELARRWAASLRPTPNK
jgi:hypothetical protein